MAFNASELYAFKNFRLDVRERLLLRNGVHVQLPEKAFEMLCVLVRQSGHLVSKDTLLAEVWPDAIVEENNLDKNVSLLRRVLGGGRGKQKYIETVRGRGYRFVENVNSVPADDPISVPATISKTSATDNPTPSAVQYQANLAAIDSIPDWPQGEGASENPNAGSIPPLEKTQAAHRGYGPYWIAIIAIALFGGLSFSGIYFPKEEATGAPISSIAVLPFENVGADAELEYLSEGLSETLIDRLSELSQLKVIARSSSFKYRGEDLNLRDVAQKLGVHAIVSGRVTRRGDELSVRVELVDVRDNKQLWGEQFKGNVGDTLVIEAQIARRVSGELRLQLSGEQTQHFAEAGTTNAEAHELLLRGNYLYSTGQTEKLIKAVESYKRAIELDPNYALAYARIARTYGLLANNSLYDPKIVVPLARIAAQKAVELDQNLADGHLQLAMLTADQWDWAAAERGYRRTLELNPSHSEAHRRYSSFLSVTGRHEEAISEAKRARELDPERMTSGMTYLRALLHARRFDELISESKKILEVQPDHRGAKAELSRGYSHKGMHAEAIILMESIRPENPTSSSQIYLGAAYARAGERKKALAIGRGLESTKEYVSPAEMAVLYTALGEREKAFALLERAYVERDLQLKYLNSDPEFGPLQGDPRFQDLLRRVGLPY
ncbi:MAG: winged helix-turn-helix domain-containing protein [Acidobacteriota bacterium]